MVKKHKTEMKKYNGIKILIILTIGIFLNANAQTIDEILPKIEIPKVATFNNQTL